MNELVIGAIDAEAIRTELLGKEVEGCAILYASHVTRDDGVIRLLVRDFEFPAAADYSHRGYLEAELNPLYVARITKRAQLENTALVFVHSHPGAEVPHFSITDDAGEQRLASFLATRHLNLLNAAIVVSDGGARARQLGSTEEMRLIELGIERRVLFDPNNSAADSELFQRQILAFGSAGQAAIQRLRVAIVGLGGTGSLISQQLAHLGVRDITLVDPDTLEKTNLNRVVNAMPDDVGKPKVEIAARYIRSFIANPNIKSIQGDVIKTQIARELSNADLIFGCTDSHGSRAVIQQVAYQYFVPCIDMGTTITTKEGHVSHIYGRIQLLSPGLACLTCSGLLNANEVRRDIDVPPINESSR